MNDELLKKLKDSGFKWDNDTDTYWKPNLSQLIEACGRSLVSLHQVPTIEPKGGELPEMFFLRMDGTRSPYLKENRWFWQAEWFTGNAENVIINKTQECNTPEEAVARLWLALLKK